MHWKHGVACCFACLDLCHDCYMQAEWFADGMRVEDHSVSVIHGDQPQEERKQVMKVMGWSHNKEENITNYCVNYNPYVHTYDWHLLAPYRI